MHAKLPQAAGFVLALAIIAVPSVYAAPPTLPVSPYGTALIDNANVPDGTIITAWCGGVSYKQTVTVTYSGQSWYYNLDIPGDDPDTTDVKEGCTSGEIISFKIGAFWSAQTTSWISGVAPRLDLAASSGGSMPTPTATATPTRTPTPTATPTQTPTPTSAATPASTASPAPVVPSGSLIDTTTDDFALGVFDSSVYVGQAFDGELMLAPEVGAEFTGTMLPIGWFGAPWGTGGAAIVGGGALTVDGALAGTTNYYSGSHVLEFVATFSANTSQHIGFGTDLNAPPWAIFSTGYPGGTSLRARTANGNQVQETNLGALLGAAHRYRIEWTATGVTYSVDGAVVATHAVGITANMRPVASDQLTGATLGLDWLRMGPAASVGTFMSRVLDAGANARWLAVTWAGGQPSGTTVSFVTRTGDSTNPDDGSWTAWNTVSGTSITGADRRYLQYRATLNSSVATNSPTIEQVAISYQLAPHVAIARGTSEVALAWQHFAGYTEYEVWRGTTPYFDPNDPASGAVKLATIPAPVSSPDMGYADSSVLPGGSYFYQVLGVTDSETVAVASNSVGIFLYTLEAN